MFGIHGDDVRIDAKVAATRFSDRMRLYGGFLLLNIWAFWINEFWINDAILENDEALLHAQWKRKLIGSDYYGMLALCSVTAFKSLRNSQFSCPIYAEGTFRGSSV
jgi:hypothetical protein